MFVRLAITFNLFRTNLICAGQILIGGQQHPSTHPQVTDRENSLLRNAMNSFNCLTVGEQSRLQHFFNARDFFNIPRHQEIKKQIISIAEEELMKRRVFLCAQVRKGVPEPHRAVFWALLSIDHLKYLKEKQMP
ncbi:hypothetical protein LSAT2_003250 [Lamellibrachia satsuma]|nr:hypothetical protein LSAT2_003250 [Lamellibrachia satsuma]